MIAQHSHVSYYRDAGAMGAVALETCRAHVVEVIDADTLTLDVDRPGVATERLATVPRCNPAKPEAGCWSEVAA